MNDASKAVELDKSYVKGYYRRAAAHMALGKFKEALKDYEYVSRIKKCTAHFPGCCIHGNKGNFVQ